MNTLPLTIALVYYRWFDAYAVSIYHCQVMSSRLPEYIDPLQLADKRGELKGQLPVSALDRLGDLLIADTGFVSVALFFGREGRLPTVDGELEGELNLCCQNCLQAVVWPFKHSVKLGIVKTIEQANRLPEGTEPLLVETDTVCLKDIIEDELLLILPAYPKHQHNCLALQSDIKHKDTAADTRVAHKKNPFSILANLKNIGDLNGSTKK